jgi:hypothetical protein
MKSALGAVKSALQHGAIWKREYFKNAKKYLLGNLNIIPTPEDRVRALKINHFRL